MSAMLPEPHGFEGRTSVRVFEQIHDLAAANFEVEIEANIDLGSAGLSSARDVDRGEHTVPLVMEFLQVGPHLVPRVKPLASDSHGGADAAGWRMVLLEREPLDLGVKSVPESVGIALERCEPLSNELKVLLRHSPTGEAQRRRAPQTTRRSTRFAPSFQRERLRPGGRALR